METDDDDRISSRNVRFVANISREYICLYASILVQLLKQFARFHLRI